MSKNPKDDEALRLASLMAHQLKAPVGAADSLLKVILGEFAGQLSARQKDILARVDRRLEEALKSVERMLSIAYPGARGAGKASTDLAALLRRIQGDATAEANARKISVDVEISEEPAVVALNESALWEAANALFSNALKYTPENGRILLGVATAKDDPGLLMSVEDSGIGIEEELKEKVFEPFFRAASALKSGLPGVGLGLAFVKSLIDAAGGRIWVEKSSLGGAAFRVLLPRGTLFTSPTDVKADEGQRMKVVIIGGVAAGPKVASKIMRLRPRTSVTIIERGAVLSYAGCGLPYYVAGVVKEQKELLSTPLGAVRDPIFFQNVKNVKVMNRTEALQIDRSGRRVRIRSLFSGEEGWIPYDKLVLATGARPVIPPLEGSDLRNIFTLHGVRDAEGIKGHVSQMKARDVVLLGGGLIGVEMTEALVARGCRVTIAEMRNQILGTFDQEIALLLTHHMESKGVRVMTNIKPQAFVGKEFVEGVATNEGILPADMVIMGVGVRPQVELALEAGLEIGPTGAIRVDEYMCTSDPHIYAAGDCVETLDILTGRASYVPLGSTANKQGRVAAVNLCGGQDRFPGVVGSTACKVFDYCVARTGLTEAEAQNLGYSVVTVLSGSPDREPFMPGAKTLMLKLVADRNSRRLLGLQCIGPGQGDKRLDVAATAITAGMTVDTVANLDLCYAPPFSLAMDNLITAANIARNKLDGHFEGVSPMEVHRMLKDKVDFVLLDLSSPGEYEAVRLPGSIPIPSGALRGRLSELPRGKEIITLCSTSLRAYEAALILKAVGFSKVRVLDGGLIMWPYEKIYGMK